MEHKKHDKKNAEKEDKNASSKLDIEIDKELEKIEEKEKEIEKKEITEQDIIIDLTNTVKRVQADFENYKKRMDVHRIESIKVAAKDIITQLLPVLDSFELALKHKTTDNEIICNGFEMIYKNFEQVLENNGLTEIDAVGKDFDPYEHEALLQEQSDKKKHVVLEVLQKGYKLNGKVIRTAKVKIAQ
ncbi:nucleotide exchange factor GrpE [Candidatus Woesearchaeota archaeon]|nr:nucleotide exchange factor GrpE [Candidatus Woesearchaeota archaeon]